MGAVIDKRLLYTDITEYFIFVCHVWRYLTKYWEPWFTNRRLFFEETKDGGGDGGGGEGGERRGGRGRGKGSWHNAKNFCHA
jgi:hypothetical protein